MEAIFDLRMDFSKPIESIESEPPSPLDVPEGCPSSGSVRTVHGSMQKEEAYIAEYGENHQVACHLYGQREERPVNR